MQALETRGSRAQVGESMRTRTAGVTEPVHRSQPAALVRLTGVQEQNSPCSLTSWEEMGDPGWLVTGDWFAPSVERACLISDYSDKKRELKHSVYTKAGKQSTELKWLTSSNPASPTPVIQAASQKK